MSLYGLEILLMFMKLLLTLETVLGEIIQKAIKLPLFLFKTKSVKAFSH